MTDYHKIFRFAEVFNEAVDPLDNINNMLWDGSPPTEPAKTNPPLIPAVSPTIGDTVPGYQRVLQTPGPELQQISAQILSQYRTQPIGTTVPFNYNGQEYIARIETHPASSRNPQPHPGVSLFVKPGVNQYKQGLVNSGPSARSQKILSELVPEFAAQVTQMMMAGVAEGLRPVLVEGRRSQDRQNELYEQGRTKPGAIVTGTRNSLHTQGLAVDIAQRDEKGQITYNATPGFWERMGAIGKSLGLTWGGDWPTPDLPHFQYKGSR